MSAAYYDIITDEGSTFRLKLKFTDINKNSINLLEPATSVIEGYEDQFPKDSNGNLLPIKAYVRMQVRDSVDGDLILIEENSLETQGDDETLWGQSNLEYSHIKIDLKDGKNPSTNKQDQPNIIITISADIMSKIPYGNFLYDIEIIFSQDIIDHPNAIVYRIMQGRFVVTPNITR
jgi:hypothetical protein